MYCPKCDTRKEDAQELIIQAWLDDDGEIDIQVECPDCRWRWGQTMELSDMIQHQGFALDGARHALMAMKPDLQGGEMTINREELLNRIHKLATDNSHLLVSYNPDIHKMAVAVIEKMEAKLSEIADLVQIVLDD